MQAFTCMGLEVEGFSTISGRRASLDGPPVQPRPRLGGGKPRRQVSHIPCNLTCCRLLRGHVRCPETENSVKWQDAPEGRTTFKTSERGWGTTPCQPKKGFHPIHNFPTQSQLASIIVHRGRHRRQGVADQGSRHRRRWRFGTACVDWCNRPLRARRKRHHVFVVQACSVTVVVICGNVHDPSSSVAARRSYRPTHPCNPHFQFVAHAVTVRVASSCRADTVLHTARHVVFGGHRVVVARRPVGAPGDFLAMPSPSVSFKQLPSQS